MLHQNIYRAAWDWCQWWHLYLDERSVSREGSEIETNNCTNNWTPTFLTLIWSLGARRLFGSITSHCFGNHKATDGDFRQSFITAGKMKVFSLEFAMDVRRFLCVYPDQELPGLSLVSKGSLEIRWAEECRITAAERAHVILTALSSASSWM